MVALVRIFKCNKYSLTKIDNPGTEVEFGQVNRGNIFFFYTEFTCKKNKNEDSTHHAYLVHAFPMSFMYSFGELFVLSCIG